jgi:hypothetical protein
MKVSVSYKDRIAVGQDLQDIPTEKIAGWLALLASLLSPSQF